jgi:hypothetical protein
MTDTSSTGLGEEALEERTSTFQALYANWERCHRSRLELDLTTDAATFASLDGTDRDGFVWMFVNRFHAEFNVARLLAPFQLAAPDYEMQLLLATQVADEHRHLQAVLRIYDEVFGVEGGITAVQDVADRGLDPVSRTLLYDTLERWVLPLLDSRDEDTFLHAVVCCHVLGEGVVARTGQNLAAAQYDRLHGFPGLIEGQRLVALDEARHIAIGVSDACNRMDADPEHAGKVIGAVVDDLLQVAAAMLDTANDGMSDLVRSGYGVDPQEFFDEGMRLTQIRLESIGYLVEAG